jgi:hypothetical protein
LRKLQISTGVFEDAELAFIGRLTNLEELDLWDAGIQGKGLEHLAPLGQLHTLNLWHCFELRDAQMKPVGRLTALKSLNLSTTKLGDKALEHLAPLRQLRDLDVMQTRVTDEGLKQVAGLPNLERLRADITEISDTGLQHLLACPKLRCLSVNGCFGGVTAAGVEALRRARPGLTVDSTAE